MKRYGYEGSEQFRPITAWGYVGYSILFAIPLIGLIFWLVFIFSDKNINRRSFARSYLCGWLLASIVAAILCGLAVFGIVRLGWLDSDPQIKQKVQEVIGKGRSDSSETKITDEANEIIEESEEQTTDAPTEKQTTVAPMDEPKKNVIEAVEENVVTPEFKEAMDSYEEFFDEYIAFMEAFDEDSSDLNAVLKMTSYMAKYAEEMEEFEEIEEDELSDADMAYYIDVSSRIWAKLAKASL